MASDSDIDATGVSGSSRPLGFKGTMSEGWRLYRSAAGRLTALFVGAYVAVTLLQAGSAVSPLGAAGGLGGVVAEIALRLALPALVGSFAMAAAAIIMQDALGGERTGALAASRILAPLWRELLAGGLVAVMLTLVAVVPPFVGLATLLGPMMFALLYGPPFVVHAIALESKALRDAWPRARALLARSWPRLLMYWLTAALGLRLVELIVTIPVWRASPALFLLTDPVVLGVLVPYLAAVIFVSFVDLRAHGDAAGRVRPAR